MSASQDEDASYDLSSPWYEELGDGASIELSPFGQVHSTLDSLVTDKAAAYCSGEEVQPANLTEARQVQVIHPIQ